MSFPFVSGDNLIPRCSEFEACEDDLSLSSSASKSSLQTDICHTSIVSDVECNVGRDTEALGIGVIPLNKCLLEGFPPAKDIDHQDVSLVLKEIRTKYVHNVIIGHLNVNSITSKFDALRTFIPSNIDIMVFSETKLADSYPIALLMIEHQVLNISLFFLVNKKDTDASICFAKDY